MTTRTALLAAALIGGAVLAGCVSPWSRYESSAYSVFRTPDPSTYDAHARLLQRVIARAERRGQKPPPGVCSECAYYLWRLDRADEAMLLLEKEWQYYPEAREFIAAQKRFTAVGSEAVAPEIE